MHGHSNIKFVYFKAATSCFSKYYVSQSFSGHWPTCTTFRNNHFSLISLRKFLRWLVITHDLTQQSL